MIKLPISVVAILSATMLFSQDWQKDFDDAQALAKKEDKPLVLVFAGSDWCAPCIKLEREIWESEQFRSHAKDNYVLYKADFPRRKKNALDPELTERHRQLAEKYNPQGHFPLLLVLNEEGGVVKKAGYKKIGPEGYINLIDSK